MCNGSFSGAFSKRAGANVELGACSRRKVGIALLEARYGETTHVVSVVSVENANGFVEELDESSSRLFGNGRVLSRIRESRHGMLLSSFISWSVLQGLRERGERTAGFCWLHPVLWFWGGEVLSEDEIWRLCAC